MYYRRETQNQPTLTEVVQGLRTWNQTHEPYDRTTHLNLFQYMMEEGTGGALVPLGQELTEGSRLPTIQLRKNAMAQYLARLQYPQHFYSRVPARLNCLNINWLVQNGNYERPALIRLQDGDQARAVMTEMYQPIDTLELLEMVEPYLSGGVVRWHADDDLTFHISISFPNHAEEIKAGDIVERGLHISNSEVGLRSVTIAGYLHRLICTNGLIGGGDGDSFRFRHVGNVSALRDKVVAAVEGTKLEVERITAQFKNALTVQIDQPFEFMEKIAKEHDLTQAEFKAALDSYMNADDKGNLYGVAQAVSNAANLFEGERSYELQRLAVQVSGMSQN